MKSAALSIFAVIQSGAFGAAFAAEPTSVESDFFETKIRPILVGRCYECHSAEKEQKGNLLFDTKEGMLGGDPGVTAALSSIRRWVLPLDGEIHIAAELTHTDAKTRASSRASSPAARSRSASGRRRRSRSAPTSRKSP